MRRSLTWIWPQSTTWKRIFTNKKTTFKKADSVSETSGWVRGRELVVRERSLPAELLWENLRAKSLFCSFHRIRGHQGSFGSSLVFSALTEMLDTKECQLMPRLQPCPPFLYVMLFSNGKSSTTQTIITPTILIINFIYSSKFARHDCHSAALIS